MMLVAIPASAGELGKFLGHYGNDVLPPPWTNPNKKLEEDPISRRDRIQMIADIVEEQSSIRAQEFGWMWTVDDYATAAFTKMWYESGRFRLRVHNGLTRGDHGKSVCLGQIMYGGNKLVGTDRESTTRCVVEVMRHLAMHQRRCLNERTPATSWSMAKVFAGYGTGHSCSEGAWMPVKGNTGDAVLNSRGEKVRNYWARERSFTWANMSKALAKERQTR